MNFVDICGIMKKKGVEVSEKNIFSFIYVLMPNVCGRL